MEWLNYHHLLYFSVVAKEGSIVAASKRLRLSHPTISTQIKQLEEMLGADLFERRGRGLVLTEVGRTVQRYADEIFSLGGELLDTVRGRTSPGRLRLTVGVIDVLPKSVVHRLLEPALRLDQEVRLVVRENHSLDAFVAQLATHDVDVVLADRPAGEGLTTRLYSHRLGESPTTFVARTDLSSKLRDGFPASLDGAPMILPTSESAHRRSLDAWFERHDLRPHVVAEVDDAALVKVLAEAGIGVCAIPSVVEEEVVARYRLDPIGSSDEITQRFYAVSADRRITHPAVLAIRRAAQDELFA